MHQRNFSPGPWEVKHVEACGCGHNSEHWNVNMGVDSYRVLTCLGAPDAHLIAAAPDLLAALKLIVDHFGDPLKVARAAIAKAEVGTR